MFCCKEINGISSDDLFNNLQLTIDDSVDVASNMYHFKLLAAVRLEETYRKFDRQRLHGERQRKPKSVSLCSIITIVLYIFVKK